MHLERKKELSQSSREDKQIKDREKQEQREQAIREKKERRENGYGELWKTVTLAVTGIKNGSETSAGNGENEFIKSFNKTKEALKKDYAEYYDITETKALQQSKYSQMEKISFATIIFLTINIMVMLVSYLIAITQLKEVVFSNFILYTIPACVIPVYVWIRSTNENFWAFHRRKKLFFYMAMVNIVLVLSQYIYTAINKFSIPAIIKLPTDENIFTKKMVLLLCYIVNVGLFYAVMYILYIQFEPLILSRGIHQRIALFKLQHIKDTRTNSQYLYDIECLKNLETGAAIRIKENDRFTQMFINGPSGTGKTSTIFGNTILGDMERKKANRELRQEKLLEMISKGKATIQGPIAEFSERYIVAIGKNEKEKKANEEELKAIRKKYPDCGMTVIAPNNSLNEDIIRICLARGITVNVVDPVRDFSEYPNVRKMGINPFYIPLNIATEDERHIRISVAASAFSDVLIATNQMDGKGDPYFTDISLAVSSNIASIVMLANNIKGKYTYIEEVQDCISNFDSLESYIAIVKEAFGLKGSLKTEAPQKGGNMFPTSTVPKEKANIEKYKSCPYYHQILFIEQELLGAGKDKMFDQARGLRNLLDRILRHRQIKELMSAGRDGNTGAINFDEILADNQITLVNTAIEIGKESNSSFGLFFLLLHRASVLRRPPATRTPHFLWVDECSQYCHPVFDDMVALYRQYRVACVLTLQTQKQLEKSQATAYLVNVFNGIGTHILFGRLSPSEMKNYSDLSGIVIEDQEITAVTESSDLASNPNRSTSTRVQESRQLLMEGSDLRNLDFLECTVFTIDAGRVLPGMHARVFFLSPSDFDQQNIRNIKWEKVVPEAFRTKEEVEEEQRKTVEKQKAEERRSSELDQSVATRVYSVKETSKQAQNISQNGHRKIGRDDIIAFIKSRKDKNELISELSKDKVAFVRKYQEEIVRLAIMQEEKKLAHESREASSGEEGSFYEEEDEEAVDKETSSVEESKNSDDTKKRLEEANQMFNSKKKNKGKK